MQPALISIHDVMPSTLNDVGELLELCGKRGLRPLTLLVVPGPSWPSADLHQLREWLNQGHELAGHGWHHKCRSISGWKHRLHSLLLSRDVAEHLSLNGDEVADLITRSARWFVQQELAIPVLYVPPAWALGSIGRHQLSASPYLMFETLGGVTCTRSPIRHSLPLVGFEADNLLRAVSLRAWNRLNRLRARATGKPLRIAIHPRDLRLRLRQDLLEMLCPSLTPCSYADLYRQLTGAP